MTECFYPKTLKPGSRIALVQPAGAISEAKWVQAKQHIKALGLELAYPDASPRQWGYLGGSDHERVEELHNAFCKPDVDAIWCVRGGYGVQRILPLLNMELIAKHPKALIGFSDITALSNYITAQTGLITYHGIMGVSAFSDYDVGSFRRLVLQHDFPISIKPLAQHISSTEVAYHPFTLRKGIALGQLVGGNLSLLASSVGTPYDVDYDGKILFIEEVSEAPYRIDRMLTQLIHAGKLDKVVGVAIGVCNGCQPEEHGWKTEQSFSLQEVLRERLAFLKVPVVYGLPFGHINQNASLPVGGKAKLDATNKELLLVG